MNSRIGVLNVRNAESLHTHIHLLMQIKIRSVEFADYAKGKAGNAN